ncbi:Similar to CFAP20: Cilia- and flagella-associated protein 20 (Paramecium tetraurelia), partial [Cotesia congregata]
MSKLSYKNFEYLLCSVVEDPLALWSKFVSLDGKIKRVKDELLKNDRVIEITGKSERTNTAREKLKKVTSTTAFIPLTLADNWNKLEINLSTLCKDTYSTDYKSLLRIKLHPNFRYRRIYLQEHHYDQSNDVIDELHQALVNFSSLKNKNYSIENKYCQTQPIINSKVTLKKRK